MKFFTVVCACFVASAFGRLATAATYAWNTNVGGSFATSTNWTDVASPFGHAVPGASDTALFDRMLNIQYGVTIPGRQLLEEPVVYSIQQLRVGTNTVSLSDFTNFGLLIPNSLAVDFGVFIGESAGQSATLNTTLKSFSGDFADIGDAAGSTGTLNVNGGVFSLTGPFLSAQNFVGRAGTGVLNIRNGAVMNVAANLFVADSLSSTGTVTVDGAGSVLDSSASIGVGYHGAAALTIRNGGRVSTLKVSSIGSSLGTTSTAVVEGAGSIWDNSADLVVGWDGLGTMTIRNGGQVSNEDGWISYNEQSAPGSGEVVVDGVGSTWTNRGDLFVAFYPESNGALHILAGGQVSSTAACIGCYDLSTGLVTVNGMGTTWTNESELYVGYVGGNGTLVVTNGGAVSASGPFSVGTNGTVVGNGHIAAHMTNAGIVAPGVSTPVTIPGALHVDGVFSQAAAGRLLIELGGSMPETGYDQLLVTGAVNLNGTLQVTLLGPFMPAAGDEFNIIDGASLSGAFSTIQLPTLAAGLMWNASQLTTAGILKVTIVGDYNANGLVDAADYTVWRNSLSQAGAGQAADGNFNQLVDAGDYGVWKSNFGHAAGSGSGANANTAVPEPAAIVMLIVGTIAALTLPTARRR